MEFDAARSRWKDSSQQGTGCNAGKVNYSHTEGIPDSITMSARTENEVLFDNVTVKNVTEWQTTC